MQSGQVEANKLYQGYLCSVAAPRLLDRHPNLTSVTELKDEYQIVVEDLGRTSQGINYSLQTGQRCWYVNDFSAKKTLIMSGIGWGRLPGYTIKDELEQHRLSASKMENFVRKLA